MKTLCRCYDFAQELSYMRIIILEFFGSASLFNSLLIFSCNIFQGNAFNSNRWKLTELLNLRHRSLELFRIKINVNKYLKFY